MKKKDFVVLDIPKKAYAIKDNKIEEVVFEAVTESMSEWYFKISAPNERGLTGQFVFAKELNRVLFLGERAKENAEDFLKRKLKRQKQFSAAFIRN